VRVQLTEGMHVAGRVLDEHGDPVGDVEIVSGEHGDFVRFEARSAADGTFRLAGVPPSGLALTAEKRPIGRATAEVRGHAGETVACALTLSNGLVLRGRVVLGDEPVARVMVNVRTDRGATRWMSTAWTAADGTFAAPYCPEGQTFELRVEKPGCVPFERGGLAPGVQPHVIRLFADTSA
jgi:hypothetical protein